jgi:hypothetical protein
LNLLEEQGVAGLLAKRLNSKFRIEDEDHQVIRQKAEFYRWDFFNAVMGASENKNHKINGPRRLPLTTHF